MGDFFFFVLYLFYGLAFFTTGVAVASRISRGSKLAINRYLWLFALFALIHACHEWLTLFFVLEFTELPPLLSRHLRIINFLSAFLSYIFLLLFGIYTLSLAHPEKRRWFWSLILLCFGLFLVFVWAGDRTDALALYRSADLRMRNFIGFPAALMTGLGLIGYARMVTPTSIKVSRSFVFAGLVLMSYGFFTGLVPSGTILPLIPLPVEVVRAITAIIMLHFIMQALQVYDYERQQQIEKSMERFAQAEKLTSLGKLAAGIAHEINNPLTNVSLNVEMLKRSLGSAHDQGKRFEAIERNLERASRIARELLAFSRQETKEEKPEPLDVNALLRDTLNLLGPRRHEYRFELDLSPVPVIQGLHWKIEEVFLNLILNAMDASEPGRPIHIGSRHDDSAVVVTFRDEGCGIPAKNLRSIFDPFFTTKGLGKGTGLGLSICFGIMQRHGGSISVASQEGSGTTQTLRFPVGVNHEA